MDYSPYCGWASWNQLKTWIDKKTGQEEILSAEFFGIELQYSALPWVFGLQACSTDFGLASFYICLNQFFKINLSLLYIYIYIISSQLGKRCAPSALMGQCMHSTKGGETNTGCLESEGAKGKTYEKRHIYEIWLTDPKLTSLETLNGKHFAFLQGRK